MIEVKFTNQAPDDKEWTAQINLLNDWTEPDRYLRSIVQYARSGPHYPADMHVDLIEQVLIARAGAKERTSRLEELVNIPQNNSKVYVKGRIADLTTDEESEAERLATSFDNMGMPASAQTDSRAKRSRTC